MPPPPARARRARPRARPAQRSRAACLARAWGQHLVEHTVELVHHASVERTELAVARRGFVEAHLVDALLQVVRADAEQRDAPLPVVEPGRPGHELEHAVAERAPHLAVAHHQVAALLEAPRVPVVGLPSPLRHGVEAEGALARRRQARVQAGLLELLGHAGGVLGDLGQRHVGRHRLEACTASGRLEAAELPQIGAQGHEPDVGLVAEQSHAHHLDPGPGGRRHCLAEGGPVQAGPAAAEQVQHAEPDGGDERLGCRFDVHALSLRSPGRDEGRPQGAPLVVQLSRRWAAQKSSMPPPPGIAGAFSSGLSTMTASVVRKRAAMDAAFCNAERVTLAASMTPSANRSVYSPVAALRPSAPDRPRTFSTTTPPSRPEFTAICLRGSSRARATIRAPVASSCSSFSAQARVLDCARRRATPPPGTTPSSMAALVVDTASSMRCFFSLSSTSVAAPTLITATPPDSFARRSWSFSRS